MEPLAEQQAAGARDVEQAARRAEEALDAELEALLRSLSEVVSSDAQQPPPPGMMYGGQLYHHPADVAAGYMGMGHMHVALAMDKVASLGTILRQVWSPCIYFLSVCLSLPSIHFNFQPGYPCIASSSLTHAGGRAEDASVARAPADPDGEAGGALLHRRRRLLLPPPNAQHALDHQPDGPAG